MLYYYSKFYQSVCQYYYKKKKTHVVLVHFLSCFINFLFLSLSLVLLQFNNHKLKLVEQRYRIVYIYI